ncbi:MAG: hypothetical protein JWO36_4092 [Myxococcales bacterium]|nr:hypothetical protein [Myxococcales bacterium]
MAGTQASQTGPHPQRSGVSASDVVQATDPGALARGNRKVGQSDQVGDAWIDHGAVCDGRTDPAHGCFLHDPQRLRLIIDFKDRVQTAATNYKIALTQLRVDELVQKDDDLNWVLSLALDVIGAHFLSVATGALKNLKTSGASKLESLAVLAAEQGEALGPWASRAQTLLTMVDDKAIETYVKAGFDPIKKGVSKAAQAGMNLDDKTARSSALSYIDQLTNGCDVGFDKFALHATAASNDAELVVLWEGMEKVDHTVGAYKTALADKISRFKKSGVNELGRKLTYDRFSHEAEVHRDTRVIWLVHASGARSLWYQSQEGDFNPTYIEKGDPNSDSEYPEYAKTSHPFGPRDPRESPVLDRRVPTEFQDIAIAKSEQKWGSTPTMEDPSTTLARSLGMIGPKGKPAAAAATSNRPSSPAVPLPLSPTRGEDVLSMPQPFGKPRP